MSTKLDEGVTHTTKKTISEQEKRDYYRAWESSGMHKSKFCKEHGLIVDEFYRWSKLFRKKLPAEPKRFSPVIVKNAPTNLQQNMTQLKQNPV